MKSRTTVPYPILQIHEPSAPKNPLGYPIDSRFLRIPAFKPPAPIICGKYKFRETDYNINHGIVRPDTRVTDVATILEVEPEYLAKSLLLNDCLSLESLFNHDKEFILFYGKNVIEREQCERQKYPKKVDNKADGYVSSIEHGSCFMLAVFVDEETKVSLRDCSTAILVCLKSLLDSSKKPVAWPIQLPVSLFINWQPVRKVNVIEDVNHHFRHLSVEKIFANLHPLTDFIPPFRADADTLMIVELFTACQEMFRKLGINKKDSPTFELPEDALAAISNHMVQINSLLVVPPKKTEYVARLKKSIYLQVCACMHDGTTTAVLLLHDYVELLHLVVSRPRRIVERRDNLVQALGTNEMIEQFPTMSVYADFTLNDDRWTRACHSLGWHLVKLEEPAPEDEKAVVYESDGTCQFIYGCGYVVPPTRRRPAEPGLRRFRSSCPSCPRRPFTRLWLCSECKSFVHCHAAHSAMVTCKCGSYFTLTACFKCTSNSCAGSLAGITVTSETPSKSKKTDDGIFTVITVGPSGTGKSTLINAIANYLTYDTLEEACQRELKYVLPCSFEIQDDDYNEYDVRIGDTTSEEENFNKLGQSCTQRPKEYVFPVKDTKIRIVDTPGLADTRGDEQDEKNLLMIKEAILKVELVHAICFVLKPNETKLTTSLELTIRRLMTLFPKTAINNVVFFFTNSKATLYRPGDSIAPLRRLFGKLREERNIEMPFGRDNIFCVDNEGFRYLCAQKCGRNYFGGTFEEYNNSWIKSQTACQFFLSQVSHLAPFKTSQLYFFFHLEELLRSWRFALSNFLDAEQIKYFAIIAHFLQTHWVSQEDFVHWPPLKEIPHPSNDLNRTDVLSTLCDAYCTQRLPATLSKQIHEFIVRFA